MLSIFRFIVKMGAVIMLTIGVIARLLASHLVSTTRRALASRPSFPLDALECGICVATSRNTVASNTAFTSVFHFIDEDHDSKLFG